LKFHFMLNPWTSFLFGVSVFHTNAMNNNKVWFLSFVAWRVRVDLEFA
jgi:hypothetical protein